MNDIVLKHNSKQWCNILIGCWKMDIVNQTIGFKETVCDALLQTCYHFYQRPMDDITTTRPLSLGFFDFSLIIY